MAEHEYVHGSGSWGAAAAAAAAPASPAAPPPFTTDTYPGSDGRLVVVLRGELDFDTAPALRFALREALGRSRTGLELDLQGVPFLDCSGLNVLLAMRDDARDRGRSMTLGARSPAVARLLDLSGTASLFPPPR
ncbi:STAS domain-containing protein [Streptomyces sp. HNM0645]|uniref:STAS domain-containing protein n=1 Tax=Streptomyces sp. HNM0645 TaxID=2782343 RepID=UPI0024B6AB41|nr:STAS domain-containing protein [Streptomyces sp. HNM0645]MDI9888252.1 STAS domain-containing protein [Streptomyces sp. HNM0645]